MSNQRFRGNQGNLLKATNVHQETASMRREGSMFTKPVLFALYLPRRWEETCALHRDLKKQQLSSNSLAFPRAQELRQSSSGCVLAQSQVEAWNYSLTDKSNCRNSSISKLSSGRTRVSVTSSGQRPTVILLIILTHLFIQDDGFPTRRTRSAFLPGRE